MDTTAYTPPKILRRLIDYYLRQKVIEEFKSKPVKEINMFKIVLIELKQKQNQMLYQYGKRLDYPSYKGQMYNYQYVLPTYQKIKWYFKKPDYTKPDYQFFENDIITYIKNPIVSYVVKTNINDVLKWDNDYSENAINEIKKILKQKPKYSNQTYQEIVFKKLNEKFNLTHKGSLKPYLIKIKLSIGSMDLTKTQRNYYNPLNLKYWDKTTFKTSNKGLKADTTYSWSDDYHRGGWKFGGITADDLELICLRNGFKVDKEMRKGKEKDKKYQYGEFANWYLHTLP
jgi:hypothetical protein